MYITLAFHSLSTCHSFTHHMSLTDHMSFTHHIHSLIHWSHVIHSSNDHMSPTDHMTFSYHVQFIHHMSFTHHIHSLIHWSHVIHWSNDHMSSTDHMSHIHHVPFITYHPKNMKKWSTNREKHTQKPKRTDAKMELFWRWGLFAKNTHIPEEIASPEGVGGTEQKCDLQKNEPTTHEETANNIKRTLPNSI